MIFSKSESEGLTMAKITPNVGVHKATHVVVNGRVEKIQSKHNLDSNGRVVDRSFGFWITTEGGETVGMKNASSYLRIEDE
jgi:hypothetical protein